VPMEEVALRLVEENFCLRKESLMFVKDTFLIMGGIQKFGGDFCACVRCPCDWFREF